MGSPAKPFRVIELITVLVIAGLIAAITLPHCGRQPTPPNQSPSTATP